MYVCMYCCHWFKIQLVRLNRLTYTSLRVLFMELCFRFRCGYEQGGDAPDSDDTTVL